MDVLADSIELRFERQPVEVARTAGLEFRHIDQAAIQMATAADVGASFVARLPGWAISCERAKDRIIRVVRLNPQAL